MNDGEQYMLEEGRVTYWQLIMLFIVSRLMVSLTYLPIKENPPHNQDIWIATLISVLPYVVLALPLYLLVKRFPKLTLVQVAEELLGKAGKFIGLLYAWFFLHLASIVLVQLGDFLTTAPYPETPIHVFNISLIVVAAYAVRKGIEPIARVGEIAGPVIIASVIGISVLLIGDMDLTVLLPISENGPLGIMQGSVVIALRTAEILLVAMLAPFLNRRKNLDRVMFGSYPLVAILICLIFIATVTTFGLDLGANRAFAFFSAMRLISVGGALERADAVYLGVWVMGVFIKVSLFFYLSVLSIAQVFDLRDYRLLILPIGAIITTLSVTQAESLIEINAFLSFQIFAVYLFFYVVMVPGLLLIVNWLRKRGRSAK